MRSTIEMAREARGKAQQNKNCDVEYLMSADALEHLVTLARADERERVYGKDIDTLLFEEHRLGFEKGSRSEREACAKKTEEFARKWWKIHCDSNKHMETTRKAHDDFCALQAAIRARGETNE
jgi:hypothetical protein